MLTSYLPLIYLPMLTSDLPALPMLTSDLPAPTSDLPALSSDLPASDLPTNPHNGTNR